MWFVDNIQILIRQLSLNAWVNENENALRHGIIKRWVIIRSIYTCNLYSFWIINQHQKEMGLLSFSDWCWHKKEIKLYVNHNENAGQRLNQGVLLRLSSDVQQRHCLFWGQEPPLRLNIDMEMRPNNWRLVLVHRRTTINISYNETVTPQKLCWGIKATVRGSGHGW